jgi:hypothetical protein
VEWTVDERIPNDEREELVNVGTTIVFDIKQLLATSNSAIQTSFRFGVYLDEKAEAYIVLYFVVTDLGGSEEGNLKTFINDRLFGIFKDQQEMVRYNVQWAFEVIEGEG